MAEHRIIEVSSGSSNKGRVNLYELTGSGYNKVSLVAPDSLSADATITTPSATATIATLGLNETFSGDKTFTGTATFTNTVTLPANTIGLCPIGSIIAVAANITGSFAIPSTGTSSAGWQLCDGAAIAGGSVLTGTTPNLTDERFLVGSTVAGTTGGANAITPAGTIGGSQSIAHTHTAGTLHAGMMMYGSNIYYLRYTSASYTANYQTACTSGPTSSTQSTSWGAEVMGSSGSMSANSTVSGSNFTFTGTSFNNRPLYLSTRYLIRVK